MEAVANTLRPRFSRKLVSIPDPMPSAEVHKIIESNMSTPRSAVERLQQVMQPMD
jgi:hypothetical protein